jgi:hypothetical protein
MKSYGEVEIQLHAFLTPAIDGGEWSASRSERFTQWKCRWIGGLTDPLSYTSNSDFEIQGLILRSFIFQVHYSAHNSPPLVLMQSHMSPVHALVLYSFKFHFSIIFRLTPRLSKSLFSSGVPIKTFYVFIFYLMRTIRSAHFILLHLFTRIIFG